MIFPLNFNNRIAVIDDAGSSCTYLDLKSHICEISSYLRVRGLAFCLCQNSIESLYGYFSFMSSDIPVVMLDAHKDIFLIRNLINLYRPRYIWAPSVFRESYLEGNVQLCINGYVLIDTLKDIYLMNPALSVLLTTSGSTGSPKLVRLTSMNLLSNAESIAKYLNIDGEERPITTLPMYYSYGLSIINSHVLKGATILLTNKSILQKEFWDFAKQEKATSMGGVPYTYEMLRRLHFFNMDLPYLTTLTQAGGKLNPILVKEVAENCKNAGKRFFVMYGQTEATARMSYLPADRAIEKSSSIGIPIPNGSISLIGTDGEEIEKPDVDGELVYKGPNVSMGYAETPSDLMKGDENKGILHTGDIAHRDKDGFYYITGRLKRFVKVWGNRCNLDAVEQIVKTITCNCACAGVDDCITVFVTDDICTDTEIKNMLCSKTGLNIKAFKIRHINEIPKNNAGKVQYAALQKMIEK